MLIVVAIIAILVAVSIPLVSSSLERARVATDAANERSAKAEATLMYLNGDLDAYFATPHDDITLPYNAVSGTFETTGTPITGPGTYSGNGYGKCTEAHSMTDTTVANGHGGANPMVVWCKITSDGDVTVSWGPTDGAGSPTGTTTHGIVVEG